MKRLVAWAASSPRRACAASAACWLVIAAVDCLKAHQLGFSIFYLLPVGLAAWGAGLRAGLVLAALCALTWSLIEAPAMVRPATLGVDVWDTLIRAGYFVLGAWATSRAHEMIEQERASSRLKSEMLAFVSHELNNSLTSLSMGLHMLADRTEDAAYRERVVPSLDRTVEHMRRATVNFLESARLESGSLRLRRRRCELPALVSETLESMRPLAEAKRIEVHLVVPDASLALDADPDALAVIVANLLGNAVKYTPPGGKVKVDVRRDAPAPGSATVAVTDTGIGLAVADIDAVVSGFHRTREGRRSAKGFGLGLSVTRRLLEAHGSRLAISSEPGKGSSFSFELPVYSDGSNPPAASPSR